MCRDVGIVYRYGRACQFRQGRREFLLTEGEDLGRKVGEAAGNGQREFGSADDYTNTGKTVRRHKLEKENNDYE